MHSFAQRVNKAEQSAGYLLLIWLLLAACPLSLASGPKPEDVVAQHLQQSARQKLAAR